MPTMSPAAVLPTAAQAMPTSKATEMKKCFGLMGWGPNQNGADQVAKAVADAPRLGKRCAGKNKEIVDDDDLFAPIEGRDQR